MRTTAQALGLAALLAPSASADVQDWFAEVGTGTGARYADPAPVTNSNVDIGVYGGTVAATYEILVNGDNHNGGAGPAVGGSSVLIGVRNTFVGDQSGAKFEQWFSTAQYGVTAFGVVDLFGPANQTGVDLHLVFVCDIAQDTTTIYENGVMIGTVPHGFALEGMVGIGQVHDPAGGDSDILFGTIYGVAVYDEALPATEIAAHSDAFFEPGNLGTNYCTDVAVANSSGQIGVMSAMGSRVVADADFTLVAEQLPTTAFGFFLVSETPNLIANPGGSQGNLCLGGAIGRFVGPGQISNSGPTGTITLALDLGQIPQPNGFVAIQPADVWYFQAWHRDFVGGAATSNFTDGLEVTFE
ncbi:MAG: hypothetical protein AAGB93_00310 [Planctomycetota bacterium]